MLNELEKLELEYPEFDDPNSPTKRVGSSLSNDFKASAHNFQMYSLENLTLGLILLIGKIV